MGRVRRRRAAQAYGRTKLAGEVAVAEADPDHAIVRTAWLFGAGGGNFVETMLRLGAERDEVAVVTDQHGGPTWTGHLSPALVEVAERRGDVGLFHAAGAGECSWYEFAVEIFHRAGMRTPRGADDERAVRAARASAGLQRPRDRARARDRPAAVAGRARGLHGRAHGNGCRRMRLLVCGGAGFIGSNFARIRARDHGDDVVVLDKLTYAGRRENLRDVEHRFVHGAIEDPAAVAEAVAGADALVNFAAETHVDRSIAAPDAFVRTQMEGTYVLLEAARERGVRYVQVSTDEVYGSIEEGSFTETSPLHPSSPYSATKAGADLLVSSYVHTYGLEAAIVRGSNAYGPYQYPEKLIPLMVLNALNGDALPVYGDGMQVRNWLFVEDFARGIGRVLDHGLPGEAYNVGGPDECANIEVVRRIVELTGADEAPDRARPRPPGPRPPLLALVDKVRALGWEPQVRFADGLERTVAWYRENGWWWEPIRSGEYRAYYERQYGRALG